ncbi:MAG: acetate/propionate family kinase, partial [Chloroflexota bacterium]|nr:acetate/propionate family kinase [Chloroflexota bacterium]
YVFARLRELDSQAAFGRVVIAHLGNGASMVAMNEGRSVDTTMGFSPTGGLVMGTRVGDLDPGVLLHLLKAKGLNVDQLSELLNRRAGLLGVSGETSEVRQLLDSPNDVRAKEAIELFCYQARKFLGSLTAVLGGLDVLVFTGGIGEHAAPVRAMICEPLSYLGITLDEQANAANSAVISAPGCPVTVRVIPTDEDAVIARETYQLVFPKE